MLRRFADAVDGKVPVVSGLPARCAISTATDPGRARSRAHQPDSEAIGARRGSRGSWLVSQRQLTSATAPKNDPCKGV